MTQQDSVKVNTDYCDIIFRFDICGCIENAISMDLELEYWRKSWANRFNRSER